MSIPLPPEAFCVWEKRSAGEARGGNETATSNASEQLPPDRTRSIPAPGYLADAVKKAANERRTERRHPGAWSLPTSSNGPVGRNHSLVNASSSQGRISTDEEALHGPGVGATEETKAATPRGALDPGEACGHRPSGGSGADGEHVTAWGSMGSTRAQEAKAAAAAGVGWRGLRRETVAALVRQLGRCPPIASRPCVSLCVSLCVFLCMIGHSHRRRAGIRRRSARRRSSALLCALRVCLCNLFT